jgi:Nucleolar protein,Nop52
MEIEKQIIKEFIAPGNESSVFNRETHLFYLDKDVREKASQKFLKWIVVHEDLDLLECHKLWKGLFYGEHMN